MKPEVMGKNSVTPLPVSYTNIPHINLPKDNVNIPILAVQSPLIPETRPLVETLEDVQEWLKYAPDHLGDEVVQSEFTKWISWAAYYANKLGPPLSPVTPSMMLPLFRESAHSPMMVFHGMNTVAGITHRCQTSAI